jgi:hypothetical protein
MLPAQEGGFEDFNTIGRAGISPLGEVTPAMQSAGGSKPIAVKFSPTQDFVRHYFQPASAYKGMLLYHSVGTGKLCSGIATATSSWDLQDYTILWVTRHTLKADIWKNMLNQVCNIAFRERLAAGKGISKAQLSKNWMAPISYKTFSNMLLKKNKTYAEIVSRNGEADPLRKTLLIIDEAHKLYSPTTSPSERPNMNIMEAMIQESYKASGADSVRILAMTATPYTESGIEMIRLLNLMRPKADQLPRNFEAFSRAYLDRDGAFKDTGRKAFMDEIAGYVSYLNQGSDARTFAYPIIQDIRVPMTYEPVRPELSGNVFLKRIKELKDKKASAKGNIKGEKEACKEAAIGAFYDARVASSKATNEAVAKKEAATAECDKKTAKEKTACKKAATEAYKAATQEIKDGLAEARAARDAAIEKCKAIEGDVAEIEKQIVALIAEYTALKNARKAYIEETNAHKAAMGPLRASVNVYRKEIDDERARIKKIQDLAVRKARRQAMKADYAKIKELRLNISSLRSKIIKLTILKESISQKMGMKQPPTMGQKEHLFQDCHLGPRPQPQAQTKPQAQARPQPPQPKRSSEKRREAEDARLAALKPTIAEFSKMLTEAYQADPATIRKAYRRLTLEYHPDKHPEAARDYEHRFKNLQQAWTGIKTRYGIQGGKRRMGDIRAR